jgi:outer membrane protein assembly factor BamB
MQSMNFAKLSLASLSVLLVVSTAARAADWAQLRGPYFNGSTDEKNLPSTWSKTENIAWSVDMAGPSAATPIIFGDRVFVSSVDDRAKTLHAICLDRKTGKVQWQHQVGEGIRRDDKSNFSSPSPSTDGKTVVYYYGNGELVSFDLTGKKLWSRNIQTDYGDFAYQWTPSASPLLYAGKLYIQVLQRDVPVHGKGRPNGESYLLALDPTTGKTLWRQVRLSEAKAESREAFTTPMPYEHNGRKELLVIGGDDLTGHDLETGKELWRWGTWNPTRIGHWRLVPSVVAGDGVILACAPKGDPIYAIKAGGSGRLEDSAVAWKSENRGALSSDVPTPAFYGGDFFILGDGRRALSRVEPRTGKVKWTVETPGRKKLEASPTVADGKVYFMNFGGDVAVVDAEKGQVLNTIAMGDEGDDMIRSSISISQGQLFIRTNSKLYCVGKK